MKKYLLKIAFMLLPLISYASAWDTDYKQIDGCLLYTSDAADER